MTSHLDLRDENGKRPKIRVTRKNMPSKADQGRIRGEVRLANGAIYTFSFRFDVGGFEYGAETADWEWGFAVFDGNDKVYIASQARQEIEQGRVNELYFTTFAQYQVQLFLQEYLRLKLKEGLGAEDLTR